MVLDGAGLFGTGNARNEFFRSSMDKAVVSYYVGGDYTATEFDASSEDTVMNLTIPANSVINGIKVRASVLASARGSADRETFTTRIKAGTLNSETTKTQMDVELKGTSTTTDRIFLEPNVVIDDLNWSEEQSVILTCYMSDDEAYHTMKAFYLIVEGF